MVHPSRCVAFVLFVLGTIVPVAMAHPLSQGSLDITVRPDQIDVRARVTLEEVSITNMLVTPDPAQPAVSGASDEAYTQHARYLAAHLHFTADGTPLSGRVIDVTPPPRNTSSLKTSSAIYHLQYALPVASPRMIELRQDTLIDAVFAPGQTWETFYFVTMSQPDRPATQMLLSRADRMVVAPNWGNGPSTAAESGPLGKVHLFGIYCVHGINHILGQPATGAFFHRSDIGFDHLLFVTALVLSTKSLWDLLKVVSAFTLAHTITLSLAALKLVHVPESVSEPLIALSIVFVAVQNVFWPEQGRGKLRLAAAFFFGLFHGLGFAGGLLETMQEMHGTIIFIAILAFSLGVELGHQIIVLPLFGVLNLARKSRATEVSRERLHFNVQRFGSAGISLAGMFYLFVALRLSFGR